MHNKQHLLSQGEQYAYIPFLSTVDHVAATEVYLIVTVIGVLFVFINGCSVRIHVQQQRKLPHEAKPPLYLVKALMLKATAVVRTSE